MKSHLDPPPVIVVSDSDEDDCRSPSDSSIVSLLLSTKPSGSKRSAKSRRGKSKLIPCVNGHAPTTDAGIRRRPTGSQVHEVIVIDCDESSDTPPRKRGRSMTDLVPLSPMKSDGDGPDGPWDRELNTENKPPSKRVKIQVDFESSVTPLSVSVDDDGRGAHDYVMDPGDGERLTRTVVHGSAVELSHVPVARPLQSSILQMRNDYPWDTARRAKQQLENSTFLPLWKKQNRLKVNPLITLELSPVTPSFWMAGGAINRIIQKPGCIAISSATLGGQPNDPEAAVRPLDSYNRAGTLQIWTDGNSKGQSTILHGHCVIESPRASEGLEQCRKCYTVNDISFDPNRSHLMASTGNNRTVQLWQDGEKLDNGCYEYPRAPNDVIYRERDSLMAVTCLNGCVYVHPAFSHGPLGDPMELRVVPPEARHSVGALVWGKGASADSLFASSESQGATDFSGYHVAFDPDQGRCTYEFSAQESGDAMALDPEGARLALCTASDNGAHFLRLYDIRRKDGRRPLQKIPLDIFFAGSGSSGSPQLEARGDGEVKAVSFSPDGLLLAIARSDDELHVYDSRFIGRSREPMRRYLHWGDDYCLGADRWGIVNAVWVDGWCGKGLGVITGGSDGCVRFWDVRRSDDDISNGEVIARPDSDIGHFSVGDPYSGEKPLVIGDNGGRVYVYDHATACRSTS